MKSFEEFRGKVALVTGGGFGIGEEICYELGGLGTHVVIADAAEHQPTTVAEKIRDNGGSAYAIEIDMTSESDYKAAVQTAVEQFGGLHYAVNSPGYGGEGELTGKMSGREWRDLVDLNLNGVAYAMRYEIDQFLDMDLTSECSIVNVASVHGLVAAKGKAAYSAAKHGVIGLTRSAAVEYGSKAIRVNAVCPGYIRNALLANFMDEDELTKLINDHPLGRLGSVREVAAMVIFLLSSNASFITGSAQTVDGGYTAV
ncbi:SDR family NAD(P)-dependent oxidoreductase [Corynebacterium propinquum]|uniref:SDR family NAD(P)-dependent oxidoreductase n=1 Tax=Corynebacterium propinquum TaxID=43769 RepID=UPI000DB1E3D2|nr:SDR family oxidoreductase [Corynebacterium propinquum]MDK4281314.1 SDR family oxidoreductase [Corynebacterium propinquum]MDK4319338.1 SDR family oxidoreductase [Corynebacterium propinquum]PZQ25610.1 MAG: short-chain dehydrogenase [Corynebacterium propinquum]